MNLLVILSILLIITFIGDIFTKHKNSKNILFIWIIVLFIISAFRYQIGKDYINHAWAGWTIVNSKDIYEIILYIKNSGIEIGGMVVGYILNFIFHNYQCYIIGLSLIECVLLYNCIIRYSEKKYYILSLLVFYFSFYLQSLNISRQYVAVLICMYSFRYIEEKSFGRFLIIILVAYLFHRSAIVFLVAYLFQYITINKKNIIIISGIVLIGSFIFKDLLSFLVNITGLYDTYTFESRSGTFNGILISLIYFLPIIYIYIVGKNKFNLKDELLFKIYFWGVIFYLYSSQFFYFNRISLYFRIFFIFAILLVFKYSKFSINKKVFLYLYLILSCFLFIRSASDLFDSNDTNYYFNPHIKNYQIEWRDDFYD